MARLPGGAHGGGFRGSFVPRGDLFSNSEFELNREQHGGVVSIWSRSSRSYFGGMEGALSLNGDVRTTMFGADYARGPLTVGLSVGRTLGLGGYGGASAGRMTSSMTGLLPVAGLPGQRPGVGVGRDRLRHRCVGADAGPGNGAGDGDVNGDGGGGDAGRAGGLARNQRVRAGVQGGRAVGRGGDRAGGRRGGPAECIAGRGDEVTPVSWTPILLGEKEYPRCRRARPPYAAEFRQQMVDLVRSGRAPEDLAREFEPSAQAIRTWVAQAGRDAGERSDGLRTEEREELRRLRRENRRLREERRDIGKGNGLVRAGGPTRETYRFMSANQARFRVATMARVLGVSPSGYYAWRRCPPSARARADAELRGSRPRRFTAAVEGRMVLLGFTPN